MAVRCHTFTVDAYVRWKMPVAHQRPHRVRPAPTPAGIEDNRRQLSRREAQAVEALLALKTTAEHGDNANASQVRGMFASLSSHELTIFTGLLQRVREGLAGPSSSYESSTGRSCECGFGEDVFSSQDPVTSLIMRADGVTEGDLRTTFERVVIARGLIPISRTER